MLATVVSEALAAIGAALDTLADNLGGSVEERITLLGELEAVRRRAGVVSAALTVGLFDEDISALGGAPHKVIADWLRITPAEARRRNRAAEPLQPRTTLTGEPLPPRQPATAQAWRAGLLDDEHVRVIQRFLAELPSGVSLPARQWAEQVLAGHARQLRPDQLAVLAARMTILLNPDGTFTDADRARRRGFRWGPQQADGMTQARLWATPELRSYLEAYLAKFAAAGMCNPADQSPLVQGEPSPAHAAADTRTVAQRQHDALMALVRSQLGDPRLGQHKGLPVTVIVSATLQELQDKTGHGLTAAGTLLPMSDIIRMASHAYHYLALFEHTTGQALWLGRTKRLASPDQRIVLHARDRGCTAPGCTVPGYGCQVHHAATDWSAGGHTNIDELAFACKHDNLLVEKAGWTTRKLPNGDTEWIPPPHLPLTGGTNTYHHPERLLPEQDP